MDLNFAYATVVQNVVHILDAYSNPPYDLGKKWGQQGGYDNTTTLTTVGIAVPTVVSLCAVFNHVLAPLFPGTWQGVQPTDFTGCKTVGDVIQANWNAT